MTDSISMSEYPNSTAEVKRFCRSGGFDFVDLQKVRDRVYRGTLCDRQFDNSSTAFIKFHPHSKHEIFQDFVDIATDVGHPECHLVDGTYTCVIMGETSGRPLSHLLPIAFVPGIWQLRKGQYEQAYYQLGNQLGVLHTATQSTPSLTISEKKRKKALDRIEYISGTLSESLTTTIRSLFADERQTPCAITYGDRSPHNIYFDGSSISQIDFAGKRRSTAYEHATVLVGLRLMHRRLPYASSDRLSTLERHYWDGYIQTGLAVPNKESIAIWCLYLYLHLLSFYRSNPSSLNAKLTQWIDPPKIRKEIHRTVETVS